MATARQLDLDPAPTIAETEVFRRATEVIGSDSHDYEVMRLLPLSAPWRGGPNRV